MLKEKGAWKKEFPHNLPPCHRVPLLRTEEGKRFYWKDERGQIKRRSKK